MSSPRKSQRTIQRTMLRMVAAAAVGTALCVGAAHASDTAVFRDVLKPNGHTRAKSVKFADARACGLSADRGIRVIMPVFEQCLRAKGWALDHYQPDPSARPRSGTVVAYTDTRGDADAHPRGDAALQAATGACKARSRDQQSAHFRQCMGANGWQYKYAQHAPRQNRPAPQQGWSASSPSYSATIDDDVRHNEDAAAATQAASDAINASNAAVAAQQAADQLQQNNIINQTAPAFPQ
jgi:hypothetical protein